jgi:hypothetical protein
MIGGLFKSASRWALVAAAGVIVGGVAMPSAKAADLGGDCCADLEERVAELEATTARKGNRKMSLTITGQVNKVILGWDDGRKSGVYYGLDNINSSSRFSFLGSAKVTPNVSMGFEIMIENDSGGNTTQANQFDEDGNFGGGAVNFQGYSDDAIFAGARRAAVWVEDKNLGRITLGRYESAGVVTTIDLAGIGVIASPSTTLLNGGFFVRGTNGEFFALKWGNMLDPADAQGRTELLRYDSPVWAGFTFSASIGEAGDQWGAMLRYAGEFSGFRVAAGYGYENIRDRATLPSSANPGPATLDPGNKPDIVAHGGGLSVLHVPTGLFAQGQWFRASFDGPGNSQYWGDFLDHKDSTAWQIQAGIAKNWFGIGNTAIYGEYNRQDGFGASNGAAKDYVAGAAGITSVLDVTDTKVTVWGLGIVQNIDAAATEVYLGYRHFDADVTSEGARLNTENFQALVGGARVKF